MHEMPHTLAMLRSGRLNEWRATLLVREAACRSATDRAIVDRRLCSDPATLDGVGASGDDRAGAGLDGLPERADAGGAGGVFAGHAGSGCRQSHCDREQRWPYPQSADGGLVVRLRHRAGGGVGGSGGGESGALGRDSAGGRARGRAVAGVRAGAGRDRAAAGGRRRRQ
nr:hypothetical protein JVH1_2764 [Rhodococcus sp. JVH1]